MLRVIDLEVYLLRSKNKFDVVLKLKCELIH